VSKKIHITSPAKVIDKACIDFAVEFLTEKGFSVTLSKNVLGQYHYFSGTDSERLEDFQHALDDDSIDFILCARGGYGSVRIIDQLDFSRFLNKPKLIIGFSDITVFHNHIHAHYKLPTVHASVPLNFRSNSMEALKSLVNVLNGKSNTYFVETTAYNREGIAKAAVVGGNLSIIYSLIGTNSDISTDGKILFMEDIGEPVYAVDRMLYALKKSNKLQNLAGLIVGGMTNMKDTEISFGKTVQEVISEMVAPYKFPVCFNFPAGHVDDNRAIILGKEAKLEVTADMVIFEQ